jgi:hypothetical protein
MLSNLFDPWGRVLNIPFVTFERGSACLQNELSKNTENITFLHGRKSIDVHIHNLGVSPCLFRMVYIQVLILYHCCHWDHKQVFRSLFLHRDWWLIIDSIMMLTGTMKQIILMHYHERECVSRNGIEIISSAIALLWTKNRTLRSTSIYHTPCIKLKIQAMGLLINYWSIVLLSTTCTLSPSTQAITWINYYHQCKVKN